MSRWTRSALLCLALAAGIAPWSIYLVAARGYSKALLALVPLSLLLLAGLYDILRPTGPKDFQ